MAIAVDDIVAAALRVLNQYGFADLSMRAIAAELGVAPGALYYHVPNKQTLLCRVAEAILGDVLADPRDQATNSDITRKTAVARETAVAQETDITQETAVAQETDMVPELARWATRLRQTLLRYRDSAELVMAVFAMRELPFTTVPANYLTLAGVDQPQLAAENVVLLVLSQVMDQQAYLVFTELGTTRSSSAKPATSAKLDFEQRFALALETYLIGTFAR